LLLTAQQLQETLDKIVRLFTYLTDKDMFSGNARSGWLIRSNADVSLGALGRLFSEYYRKTLAKRLLLQRSASKDAEQSLIGKLKVSMRIHVSLVFSCSLCGATRFTRDVVMLWSTVYQQI